MSSEEGEDVVKSVIARMVKGEIRCPGFKEVKWGTVMEVVGADVLMCENWCNVRPLVRMWDLFLSKILFWVWVCRWIECFEVKEACVLVADLCVGCNEGTFIVFFRISGSQWKGVW